MANPKRNLRAKVSAPYGRRPSLIVDEKLIEKAKELSGKGLTQQQMSDYFSVVPETWYSYQDKYPELREAIKVGRARTIAYVASKLMTAISNNSVAAMIFYLKTQAGWKEQRDEVAAGSSVLEMLNGQLIDITPDSKVKDRSNAKNNPEE